jgi:hypothetical protein
VRSFKSETLLYGNWFGGYVKSERAVPGTSSFKLWDMLLSGASMPCYFMLGSIEGATRLDLSFAQHFPANALALLASGVGECLVAATMQENAVAIHYSEASLEVMDCELGLGYPSNCHNSWCSVLMDLGIASHYIDRQEIEAGELSLNRFRVLILPNSVALSTKEVKALKAFVKKGGTIIADLRPGMLNEHGLYLAKGALDGLFGVTRQSTTPALRLEPFDVTLPGGETLSLSKTHVDPTVALATGKGGQLPDGVPVAIENTYGDGKAYLLNFNVHPHYMENNDWALNDQIMPYVKKDDGLLPLIRMYLEQAGVQPLVNVASLDGKALPPLRRNLFTCGDAKLVTILESPTQRARNGKAPEFFTIITDKRHVQAAQDTRAVQISMESKWHVFDLVAKKPLGELSAWSAPVQFGDIALYALYPVPPVPPAVEILAAPTATNLDAVVEVELKGANRDLLSLQLTAPDGRVCEWFKPLLWTCEGKVTCSIAFAWNDAPGTYMLTARRVLTGQTGTVELTVL